LPSEATLSKT
jgi:hypothetical protein